MGAKLPPWPAPAADPASDADLLRRFAAARDEAAFEALVWRHGPSVRAVCRFALGNAADADDAFQATFLVLARKAATVRDPGGVGRWLVAVAGRVARKARGRRTSFPAAAEDLAVIPARTVPQTDDPGAVFDEVDRLPEKYRLPVFLVYVAGQTTQAAADTLGVPKGTLLTRLAWARKVLAGRLAARGLAPAVAAAAVIPLDPHLVRATVSAAAAYAAGASVLLPAVPLSDGVIRSMTAAKFTTAAGVLFAAVALTGIGVGAGALTAADPPGKKPKVAEAAPGTPRLETPMVAPPSAPVPSGRAPILDVPDSLDAVKREIADLRTALDEERAKAKAKAAAGVVPPDRDPDVLWEWQAQLRGMRAALEEEKQKTAPRAEAPPPGTIAAGSMIPPTPTAPAPKPAAAKAAVKEFVIGRPVGTWHRAAGSHRFLMKFSDADNRLLVTNTVATENGPVLVSVEADYSVGKDGVIFGYITGIESTGGTDLDHLIDTPFSFRFRADDTVLTVKDVKLAGAGKDEAVLFVPGRYSDQMVAPAPPPVPSAGRGNMLPLPLRPNTELPPPSQPNMPRAVPSSGVPRVSEPIPPVRAPTKGVPAADVGPGEAVPDREPLPPTRAPGPDDPRIAPPVREHGAEAVAPTRPVGYEPRQSVVANEDGTYSYRQNYVPVGSGTPRPGDGFTRPDGSNRLLGPAKPPPPAVPSYTAPDETRDDLPAPALAPVNRS